MRRQFPDDINGFRAAVREETKRSRFRDRWSRERIHPVQHDVNRLLNFIIERRRRSPSMVFDAARTVLKRVDTDAIRLLVSTVLDGGCGETMRRRCARLIGYCEIIEAALALRERTH